GPTSSSAVALMPPMSSGAMRTSYLKEILRRASRGIALCEAVVAVQLFLFCFQTLLAGFLYARIVVHRTLVIPRVVLLPVGAFLPHEPGERVEIHAELPPGEF